MKKNLLKRGIAVAAAISLLFADTANAGVWYQRSGSWFVKDEASGKDLSGWYQDEKKDWYYLEPSADGIYHGALRAGWLPLGRDWYFLNPVHDGYFGRAFLNTWLWIDGYCYCFDENGKMYSSCETPDGYTINQAGQWTVNGVVQYIAGKGIQTKQSGSGFNSGSSGDHSSGGSESNSESTQTNSVKVTVHYQDADTGEILETRVLSGKAGEKVSIDHPDFGGYKVLDGQPVEVSFGSRDTEVTVLYRKTLFVGGIRIQYVDTENQKILAEKTVSGRLGEIYIAHVAAIDGYKAQTEEDLVLTFLGREQTAKIEYRPIRDGEEPDQKVVTNDRLKVAQADSAKEQEVLEQIYDGIFDFQQNEDGTVEIVVYNDNPIYQYILDGKYTVNDIVYVEPSEQFISGLTFLYQSHNDEYYGEEDGYDAEKCEVIHGWQVSPFDFFAPGTNIEVEIPAVTPEMIGTQTSWPIGVDTGVNRTRSLLNRSTRESSYIALNATVDGKKMLERILPESRTSFIQQYIKSLELEIEGSMGIKDLIFRIHIPIISDIAGSDDGIISNKKGMHFQVTPYVKFGDTLTTEFQLNGTSNEGDSEENSEEERENALSLSALGAEIWMQGIDFDDKNMYPLLGWGFNIITKRATSSVQDMISNGQSVVRLNSLGIYVGAVLFGVLGKPEASTTLTLSHEEENEYTMGMKISENWDVEVIRPPMEHTEVETITAEAEGSFGIGTSLMVSASIAGMMPACVGPEVGIQLDGSGSLQYKLTVPKENAEEDEGFSGSGKFNMTIYGQLRFLSRIAAGFEFAGNGAGMEMFAVDESFDLFRHTLGTDTVWDGTTITVKDENDVFEVCEETGEAIGKTASPVFSQDTGAFSFTCPSYILQQEGDEKKAYYVKELQVKSPVGAKTVWERLHQPRLLERLVVSADLGPDFTCDYSTAPSLKELALAGYHNQMTEVDLGRNRNLEKAEIASEALENIVLPSNRPFPDEMEEPETPEEGEKPQEPDVPILDVALKELIVSGGDAFNNLDLSSVPELQTLKVNGGKIDDLDLHTLENLETLTLNSLPLVELDVSENKKLKALDVQSTELQALDVRYNRDLTSLKTNSKLKKFTGNGKVMPDRLKWYKDEERTIPVTSCAAGQTIYSELSGEITWERVYSVLGKNKKRFKALDRYGNDLSSDWPGYNPESGWVEWTDDGYLKVPQYMQWEAVSRPFKVANLSIKDNDQIKKLDCTEAPDIEKISIDDAKVGEIVRLPQNMETISIIIPKMNGEANQSYFPCDFENAPKLKEVLIDDKEQYKVARNWNFSQNEKLEKLEIRLLNDNDVELKLPDNGSLRDLNISYKGSGKTGYHLTGVDLSAHSNLEKLTLRVIGGIGEAVDVSDLYNLKELRLYDYINGLDLSNCLELEKLALRGSREFKHLDLSQNKKIRSLNSDFHGLETFTGNGFVMPRFISIPAKWYADPEKTQEVTSCAAGQTIYSSYYGQDQEKLTAVQLPDPSLKPDNGLLPDGEEPPKEEILPGDGTAELASPSNACPKGEEENGTSEETRREPEQPVQKEGLLEKADEQKVNETPEETPEE